MAQIAFGLYLLHDSLAKSDSAVVRILQGHINEMDEFLSSTTANFEVGNRDIMARVQYLQVPIDETGRISSAFDKLLKSREFRAEMIVRNEKVDIVVQRASRALQASLRDVKEALSAVDELAKYFLDIKDGWRKVNLVRVYSAMRHNVAMWFRCCVGLEMKAARLGEKINGLQALVRDVAQRTGTASRKYGKVRIPPQTGLALCLIAPPLVRQPVTEVEAIRRMVECVLTWYMV